MTVEVSHVLSMLFIILGLLLFMICINDCKIGCIIGVFLMGLFGCCYFITNNFLDPVSNARTYGNDVSGVVIAATKDFQHSVSEDIVSLLPGSNDLIEILSSKWEIQGQTVGPFLYKKIDVDKLKPLHLAVERKTKTDFGVVFQTDDGNQWNPREFHTFKQFRDITSIKVDRTLRDSDKVVASSGNKLLLVNRDGKLAVVEK